MRNTIDLKTQLAVIKQLKKEPAQSGETLAAITKRISASLTIPLTEVNIRTCMKAIGMKTSGADKTGKKVDYSVLVEAITNLYLHANKLPPISFIEFRQKLGYTTIDWRTVEPNTK